MGKNAAMIPHDDFDKTENANAIAWSVGSFLLTTARKICWCCHVFSPKRETRKLDYSVRGNAGAQYDIILFGRGRRHSKRVLFSGCLTADGPVDVKIPLTVEDPVSEEKMQIAVVVYRGELTIESMYYE